MNVLAVMRNISKVVLQGEARSCMREDMSKAYSAVESLIEAAEKAKHKLLDEGLVSDANALNDAIERVTY